MTFFCFGAIIMLMFDYHMHTHYSSDCSAPVSGQLDAAVKAGLQEVCLTDHIDFDQIENGKPLYPPANLMALQKELETLRGFYPSLMIKRGAEVALNDEACAQISLDYIKSADLDFVIGSLHVQGGLDVYRPEFFEGKQQKQAYEEYLEGLNRTIRTNSYFCAMGHYDFVAKNAPFADRALAYTLAPDVFDDVFRYLIQNGKTLELNTSAWRSDAPWGLAVFTRFRELGGEFVTVGSDAHQHVRVGARFSEAYDLLRAAGIRYVATYEKMKPVLHKI